ncbi:MAG: NfeD family protein [Oceanicoccus sp.]|uniref:NfeD family protein n=1 Tax=Oceanicoccus sp. TaxID=2691044 RepID=UPI00260D0FE7|nr:NfeD family protein [Oceanicoccus sp.]MCP3907894.1 NfeD family protein [Oceanicoccus sp.]MDG1773291.1 NfeD family protein [Oceanicoccus sp.]
MDIVQYFLDDHARLLFLLSGISFAIELTIMGLGGPLLFFAIATFITGILVSAGVITGWESEILVVGVLTAVIAITLWKPLKNLQNNGGGPDTSSDMIGQNVASSSEITRHGGTIRYSGIDWNARLDAECSVDNIAEGERCLITAVDGNVMIVLPAN